MVELFGGGRMQNSNRIQGYVFKADIAHYFDSVDHDILLAILKKKVGDGKIIWLARKILKNFLGEVDGKGMPLGNYTSQFFANVYLNELDYFVKHELRAKYYIRYVDDFVILHRNKKRLEYYKKRIIEFLKGIKLELHPDKSDIIPLQKGITFLGYRIFYHYKLLRKRNKRHFLKNIDKYSQFYSDGIISDKQLIAKLQGWFGYSQWADTYLFRKEVVEKVKNVLSQNNSKLINELHKFLDTRHN